MSTIKREFAKYAALNILGQLAYACYTVADTFLVAARVGADDSLLELTNTDCLPRSLQRWAM